MEDDELICLLRSILAELTRQDDDLLSAEDISRMYDINIQKVRKIFREDNLPVMRNIKPQKVLKSEWFKYCSKGHE